MPGYEIASAWQSARLVGGDYFDILPLNEKRWEFVSPMWLGRECRPLLMSNLQAAVRGLSSVSVAPIFSAAG